MYQTGAMGIGVLISFMLLANGALQTAFGAATSLLILHATGTVAVLAILLIKRAPLSGGRDRPVALEPSGHQHIEFAHAAPALPAQARHTGLRRNG